MSKDNPQASFQRYPRTFKSRLVQRCLLRPKSIHNLSKNSSIVGELKIDKHTEFLTHQNLQLKQHCKLCNKQKISSKYLCNIHKVIATIEQTKIQYPRSTIYFMIYRKIPNKSSGLIGIFKHILGGLIFGGLIVRGDFVLVSSY